MWIDEKIEFWMVGEEIQRELKCSPESWSEHREGTPGWSWWRGSAWCWSSPGGRRSARTGRLSSSTGGPRSGWPSWPVWRRAGGGWAEVCGGTQSSSFHWVQPLTELLCWVGERERTSEGELFIMLCPLLVRLSPDNTVSCRPGSQLVAGWDVAPA